MYLPEHFAERRREVLLQVIRDWPLATVVTHHAGGLTANHVPLIVVEVAGELRLQGHVPKANPMGGAVSDAQVLVIFQGPQAYVSPSWYPAKQEHGRVVPTWNYQARSCMSVGR